MNTRIKVDYFIETAFDLEAAAEAITEEQSSGTFFLVQGGDAGPKSARCCPRRAA